MSYSCNSSGEKVWSNDIFPSFFAREKNVFSPNLTLLCEYVFGKSGQTMIMIGMLVKVVSILFEC